jgi:Methyltransferase domain
MPPREHRVSMSGRVQSSARAADKGFARPFAASRWAMVFWSRLVIALALWCAEPAHAQPQPPPPTLGRFEPTPIEVVERMLQLANVTQDDVVYDLGSGDGRIVITAAKKYGIKAVGFEINPALVEESRETAKREGLEHLVEFREQDVRHVDFRAASVVTMYLYPAATLRLRSALRSQLKPGARVVSHKFGMGDWAPLKTEQLKDSAGLDRTIYLWRIESGDPR